MLEKTNKLKNPRKNNLPSLRQYMILFHNDQVHGLIVLRFRSKVCICDGGSYDLKGKHRPLLVEYSLAAHFSQCDANFQWHRWNCSSLNTKSRNPHASNLLKKGT
uniref:Protein Wnt n=1 Tax=Glossina brevipalpis TaxID=37001 RepID=A0A1A9WUE3_9MUSC